MGKLKWEIANIFTTINQQTKMTPAQSKIIKSYSLVPSANIQAYLMVSGNNADLFECLCFKYYIENKHSPPK
jgi:hypothetical protein